jgi:NAD-dependent histone deacetylase SIR2/mono-ADP-ribosyltransferase sirtuin 6
MADTAIKSEDEKKEYFDTKEELDRKVTRLAELVKKSKFFIGFTGGNIEIAEK